LVAHLGIVEQQVDAPMPLPAPVTTATLGWAESRTVAPEGRELSGRFSFFVGWRPATPSPTDNVSMLKLDGALALGAVGVVIYATISILVRGVGQPRVTSAAGARWQATHFERDGQTHIVVRKVLPDGATVVDEHRVATLAEDDPEYDAKFLDAMAQARERVALFESEEP
jgi:hypothetical protein